MAPGGNGNIPFQLVKAKPAMGSGAMTGVTYVQRSATKGGVAPALACGAGTVGAQGNRAIPGRLRVLQGVLSSLQAAQVWSGTLPTKVGACRKSKSTPWSAWVTLFRNSFR